MARVGDLLADASNSVYELTCAELLSDIPTPVISVFRAQLYLLVERIDAELRERGLS